MTISKGKMRRQFESNPLVLRLSFCFFVCFFLWMKSSKRVLAMVCDNLSKYFPIVMNFSGYLPFLSEDTSALQFSQVPHVFVKTFFGRRIDLPGILDFRGLIHPK